MVAVQGLGDLSHERLCQRIDGRCEKKEGVLVNSLLSHLWGCMEEKEKMHGFRYRFVDGEKEQEVEEQEERGVCLKMYGVRHPNTAQRWEHRMVEAKRAIFE